MDSNFERNCLRKDKNAHHGNVFPLADSQQQQEQFNLELGSLLRKYNSLQILRRAHFAMIKHFAHSFNGSLNAPDTSAQITIAAL